MKNVFYGTLALLAAGSLSAEARPAQIAANWTGCYIGAQVGYGWGDTEERAVRFTASSPESSIWGGLVGCDYQFARNWLIGIQGEYNSFSSQARNDYANLPFFIVGSFESQLKSYGSVTARLGYVAGPWLLYGKGGAAWSRNQFRDSGFAFLSSYDLNGKATLSGWTAGAGVEYMIAPNWTVFTEYSYYDFGTDAAQLNGISGGFPASLTLSIKQSIAVAKIGVTYRFGGR